MAPEIFIQRSRLGRRIFELRGHTLTITRVFAGKKSTAVINMRHVTPAFTRARGRNHLLVQIPLFLALILALCIRLSLTAPQGLREVIIMTCGVWIAFCLVAAVRGFAPIEAVRFIGTNGRVRFDLVKEKKQAQEFEFFVESLRRSIEEEEPNQSTNPTLTSVTPSAVKPPHLP
jgi:hypothetical protein